MNFRNYYNVLIKSCNSFLIYLKRNKKQILINYLVFFIIFAILLVIDQVVKITVWDHGDVRNGQYIDGSFKVEYKGSWINPESIVPDKSQWKDYSIIGIRYIWHKGVTFLPNGISIDLVQALSMIIFIIILTTPLYIKNFVLLILLSLIAVGDMGNMLDRFIFVGHVKDMFYVPFVDKGTFNIADVFVIVGSVSFSIYFIVDVLIDYVSKKKNKENTVEIE